MLLIRQFWPLRILAFQVSERSASKGSFDESDELLSTMQDILREVDRETLDAVFQEWMIRLQKCIDGNGEYIE
jgi:hypothetical protein